tara:strand:- start:24 stop:434 length:411 start_codon:yes stop_codon:yes gene_type:complete
MSLDSEIYDRLSGFAALTALASARIYPGVAPQGSSFPYVTYFEVSGERSLTSGPTYNMGRPRFQFSAWGKDRGNPLVVGYDSARAVVDQLRAALDPFTTATGTIIQSTFFIDESYIYEAVGKVHQFAVDYEINYET